MTKTTRSAVQSALLILTPLLASSVSAADIELYGFLDSGLGYTHTKRDLKSDPDADDGGTLAVTSGVNKGARWGIRGSEDLGNGTKVSFVLESGFRDDDGGMTLNNRLFGRQATLALSGNFGEVAAGRVGPVSSGAGPYALTGWMTPFGTAWGNYTVTPINYFFGYERFDNLLTYRTPSFSGFQMTLQWSPDTDSKKDTDSTTAGVQHGTEGDNTTDRYWGAGFAYKVKKFSAAVTVDSWRYETVSVQGENPDDSLAVTFATDLRRGDVHYYAGAQWYQNGWTKYIGGFDNWTAKDCAYQDGWGVMAGFDVRVGTGTALFAAGYTESDPSFDGVASDASKRWGVSIGYEYPLSKRTALYGVLAYDDNRHKWKAGGEDTYKTIDCSVGMWHRF